MWRTTSIAIAALAAGVAYAGEIPKQTINPKTCAGSTDCLKSSFIEYKTAILDEYDYYRIFEKDLDRAIRNNDAATASSILARMIDGGRYVHNSWNAQFDRLSAQSAGLDPDIVDAITYNCRVAISYFKFTLIDIQNHPDQTSEDYALFKENSKVCDAATRGKRKRGK